MATLEWRRENANTATLYVGDEQLGTVVKKKTKNDEKPHYFLTARVEKTWWSDVDLEAMDLPHAKQLAELQLLKELKRYRDDYDYKAAKLSSSIESIDKCFARFADSDIQFDNIVMDMDGKGVRARLAGSIMGKLDRLFGLVPQDGVGYDLYVCYRRPERMTTLICNKNDNEHTEAFQIEVSANEYSILEAAILKHIRKEYKHVPSDVFDHEMYKRMVGEVPNSGDYAIYQLSEKYPEAIQRMHLGGKQLSYAERFDLTLYEKVFSENCKELIQEKSINYALEKLFAKFNTELPEGYTGRKMSIGDLLAVNKNGTCQWYYCDTFGFSLVYMRTILGLRHV